MVKVAYITFISVNNLTYFMLLVADGFPCDKCGRYYRQKGSLYKHKKYECGKIKSFSCYYDGCQYKASRKDTLKTHLFRHEMREEKTYNNE